MKSTEKLRSMLKKLPAPTRTDELMIADMLKCISEIEREVLEGYMKRPLDADGVPVRVGDDTTHGTVTKLHFDGKFWSFSNENGVISFAKYTSHQDKTRTVEDVLNDYARACEAASQYCVDVPIEKYAAELQMRSDAR